MSPHPRASVLVEETGTEFLNRYGISDGGDFSEEVKRECDGVTCRRASGEKGFHVITLKPCRALRRHSVAVSSPSLKCVDSAGDFVKLQILIQPKNLHFYQAPRQC